MHIHYKEDNFWVLYAFSSDLLTRRSSRSILISVACHFLNVGSDKIEESQIFIENVKTDMLLSRRKSSMYE